MKSEVYLNFMIIVAVALGVAVVVDMVVLPILEAEAVGCRTSQAVNASKGRCIKD